MDFIIQTVIQNWEYILIGILAIDKAVALSPSKWDDLIWTSIKKAIFKVVGKQMLKMVIKKLAKRFKLKDILIKVGDAYVQGTRSETDDKVWEKAKGFIKEL